MGIIEFLCDRRFHQIYTLPLDPRNERPKACRISYADFGDRESNAVVLLCGALMGGRFAYSPLDQLAKKHNVRILHPDRFGIGGSDAVPLERRIQLWLEMVPQLLAHLCISRVSIASHSGGVIYALNTMSTYPDLLSDPNPYVCFFAPWVHHSHSKINSLTATALLPAAVIGEFAHFSRFISKFVSLSGLGRNALQAMNVSGPTAAFPMPTEDKTNSLAVTTTADDSPFDIDLDNSIVVEELRRLIVTYHFAEATVGQSGDAQLFLKKPHSLSWSSPGAPWSDIDDFVPFLMKTIDEEEPKRSWTVDAFHAQDDNMVSERGRAWFDSCWTPAKSSSETDKDTSNYVHVG